MSTKALVSASLAAASLFSVGAANAGPYDLTNQTAVTAAVNTKDVIASAHCAYGVCTADSESTPYKGWELLSTDIKISGWKPKGVNLQVHADIECGTIFSSKDWLNLVSYNYNAGLVKMKAALVQTKDAWGNWIPVADQKVYDIGTYGPNGVVLDDGAVIACKSVSAAFDVDTGWLPAELFESDYDKAMGTHSFTWVTSKPVLPGTYSVKLIGALQADALNCSLPGDGVAESKAFVRKRIMTVESINVGDKVGGGGWFKPWTKSDWKH